MQNKFTVEASVHKQLAKGYRVKVSIPEIGIYINGMVVFPPSDEHPDWNVCTPAQRAGRGKYTHFIEFNKKLELWGDIYEACVEAVKQDMVTEEAYYPEITDESISRALSSLDI